MSDIRFKLNVDQITKNFDFLRKNLVEDIRKQIGILASEVYDQGLYYASKRLHQSFSIWKDGYKFNKIGDGIYEIYIEDGHLAENYENGYGNFDMKPGFLNSPKAKTTKDGFGKYLDIPFNITPTPTNITDIKSAVSSVLVDTTINKRIEEFNQGSTGLTKFGEVTRFDGIKDDRIKGLVGIKPPNGTSNYFIFRRVSKNSSPNKWIHPGIDGAHVFRDLENFTTKRIEEILKKILG